jgi:hydroxymethylpyrimidine pyrophosphatase-like HAD family hydrolase
MQYLALATDYDGTLAHDGHVAPKTLAALHRLKESGRKLIMVTGREMPELRETFAELAVFDLVVAENGGLLYWPDGQREQVLAEAPPAAFVAGMADRGITPFSVGRAIVATWHPHEAAVLELIQELGLEYQLIFNKGAVMILPSGVNKATGLAEALNQLELSPEQVVGVGDAENDHTFLDSCAVAVAVDNAIDSLKAKCDLVMPGHHGQGVVQLIDRMLSDDLASLGPREPRRKQADRAGQPPPKQPTESQQSPETPPVATPPEEQTPEPSANSAKSTSPRPAATKTAKPKRKS